MSGHNKWSKIKHKKASSDAKKSKEFSKYSRLISTESRLVGGDTSSPSLKMIIDKAKSINMPKENIERAVQKGVVDTDTPLEKVVYEAYGPAGVAIIIEVLTDNRNRSAQEVKRALSLHGHVLAEIGSASWAFTRVDGECIPSVTITLSSDDAQKLQSLVDDLEEIDDVTEVYSNAE